MKESSKRMLQVSIPQSATKVSIPQSATGGSPNPNVKTKPSQFSKKTLNSKKREMET